jgi:hypothetical protein
MLAYKARRYMYLRYVFGYVPTTADYQPTKTKHIVSNLPRYTVALELRTYRYSSRRLHYGASYTVLGVAIISKIHMYFYLCDHLFEKVFELSPARGFLWDPS